jgi:hypothetical protein
MVLLSPLRELFSSMEKHKKNSSTVLCFGTCACCAIEALGKFCTGRLGRRTSWHNFEKWIDKYMHKDFSKTFNGIKYKRLLWDDFRNGLAHGFTIKNGGYDFQTNYFEVKSVCGVNQLEIDPKQFYLDFLSGFNSYIADLKKASPSDTIYRNFDKTFKGIFISGL